MKIKIKLTESTKYDPQTGKPILKDPSEMTMDDFDDVKGPKQSVFLWQQIGNITKNLKKQKEDFEEFESKITDYIKLFVRYFKAHNDEIKQLKSNIGLSKKPKKPDLPMANFGLVKEYSNNPNDMRKDIDSIITQKKEESEAIQDLIVLIKQNYEENGRASASNAIQTVLSSIRRLGDDFVNKFTSALDNANTSDGTSLSELK